MRRISRSKPNVGMTKIWRMDIRQLSVTYQAEQDRLLICINTSADQEVQMWLTRRMTLRIWPLLNRLVIEHFAIPPNAVSDGFVDLANLNEQTRAALVDLRRQEALQAADFSKPYQGHTGKRLLGEVPLLVTEVNLTPKGQSQLEIQFQETLQDPVSHRTFSMEMPADLVFSVMQLLENALAHTEWQDTHALPMRGHDAEDAEEVDLSPQAQRPQYLN